MRSHLPNLFAVSIIVSHPSHRELVTYRSVPIIQARGQPHFLGRQGISFLGGAKYFFFFRGGATIITYVTMLIVK